MKLTIACLILVFCVVGCQPQPQYPQNTLIFSSSEGYAVVVKGAITQVVVNRHGFNPMKTVNDPKSNEKKTSYITVGKNKLNMILDNSDIPEIEYDTNK